MKFQFLRSGSSDYLNDLSEEDISDLKFFVEGIGLKIKRGYMEGGGKRVGILKKRR